MAHSISYFEPEEWCEVPKVVEEARKWVGYCEHSDTHFLGLFEKNVGKGGCTAFAEIVRQECGRNLQGLPWCAVFVYAMFVRAYGAKFAKRTLGRPHATAARLATALKWRGLYKRGDDPYTPVPGDIVFFGHDGKINHCGIVTYYDPSFTHTIEGNAANYKYFGRGEGGAVAYKGFMSSGFMGYGTVGRMIPDADKDKWFTFQGGTKNWADLCETVERRWADADF